jgi:flagellar biosynthesis protein FlhG
VPESNLRASGLERLFAGGPVKVIAVSSGKGGVGKTSISVNIALCLARSGRSTLLVDADFGLANVDVLLGLAPAVNIAQVLAGEIELMEAVVEGPSGLRILPGASGIAELASLSAPAQHGFINAFSMLPFELDVMVIDTAPGIDRNVAVFCQAAHEVIVVVCDEPASIADAFALVKVLSHTRHITRFHVLGNRVIDDAHGRMLFRALLSRCDRAALDVSLVHLGSIPEDACVALAARQQRAVAEAYPSSPAGIAFEAVAARADSWNVPAHVHGRPVFFLERALAAQTALPELPELRSD